MESNTSIETPPLPPDPEPVTATDPTTHAPLPLTAPGPGGHGGKRFKAKSGPAKVGDWLVVKNERVAELQALCHLAGWPDVDLHAKRIIIQIEEYPTRRLIVDGPPSYFNPADIDLFAEVAESAIRPEAIRQATPVARRKAHAQTPAATTIRPAAAQVNAVPFLKWAGGKRQLLPHLLPILKGAAGGRYHEPFLGGGAAFFALFGEGLTCRLSDLNRELIDTYRAVRDDVDDVISHLREHDFQNNAEYFYRLRDTQPSGYTQAAARLIYLNKTCFNGLYRVNQSGHFNVPWGHYKNPTICDEPNLRAVSEVLATTELEVSPFEAILDHAAPDDLVYLDPPYVPASATAKFTQYTPGGFGLPDQNRLADVVRELDKRSVRVVISNADSALIRRLYEGFRIDEVQARRNVNSRGDGRGPVGELIVRNF